MKSNFYHFKGLSLQQEKCFFEVESPTLKCL